MATFYSSFFFLQVTVTARIDVDKNILTSGAWLNDKLINAAQYLLKNQFSCTGISGFQDTLLQITSTFEIEASRPLII